MEHLQYPIGRFEFGKKYSFVEIGNRILQIAYFPKQLISVANSLTEKELEQAYRQDGWTVRQVIHHLADSHMNAYIRLKLALTEHNPEIKPYQENLWAQLPDGKNAPIEFSLTLIEALHQRWVYTMNELTENDFKKTYFHPQYERNFQIDEFIALYAWHGNHHLAHIQLIATKK